MANAALDQMCSDDDRNAMLSMLVHAQPPELVQWREATVVHRELAAELDEQIANCTSEQFAAGFARKIGLAQQSDYLQRVLDVNHSRLLCGIRFFAGDARKPFVDLIAWTSAQLDVCAAASAAMEAYAVFAPRHARLFHAGNSAPALSSPQWICRGDQVVCAETLAAIARRQPPPMVDRVQLADASVDEAFDFMAEAYDAFAQRAPELAPLVLISDREELVDCHADGRLAWWLLDGVVAGMIAVQRMTWMGLDGYLIVEEVVSPQFVGRSTASAAQWRMAESLAASQPTAALYGTIDMANLPSRRTAARVGRREIASWWFIEPTAPTESRV